jgi:hypothetical protein
MSEDTTYRTVEGEEFRLLAEGLSMMKSMVPYPETAKAIVAEVDGKVIGFGVLQQLPHGEPAWVDPEYRGNGIGKEIFSRVNVLMDQLGAKWWVACSTSEASERLCRDAGMTEIPGKLFIKEPKGARHGR